MVIGDKRPVACGELPIIAMEAKAIEAQPPKMRDVIPHDLLYVQPPFGQPPVIHRERRVIVHAEAADFRRIIRPSHDALPVHMGKAGGRFRESIARHGQDNDRAHRQSQGE